MPRTRRPSSMSRIQATVSSKPPRLRNASLRMALRPVQNVVASPLLSVPVMMEKISKVRDHAGELRRRLAWSNAAAVC